MQTLLMLIMVSLLYTGAISEVPESVPVQFMSLFPVSAPVTTLLRAAAGNVSISQVVVAVSLMAGLAAIAVVAAVQHYSGRKARLRPFTALGRGR
jgi:ABC-type Na+ efflux pump permease subunit